MSAAAEALKGMPKKEKKAPEKKANPADFYVTLLILKQKRRLLTLALMGFGIFAFVVLNRDISSNRHWLLTGLPLIGVGFLVCLVPPTEGYSYRPWQNEARQYEQHQTERRNK